MVSEGLANAIESSIKKLTTMYPECFRDRARVLIEEFPELRTENVIKIKFRHGKTTKTVPKIFYKSGDSLVIAKSDSPTGNMKLAALLYTIGRLLDVEVDIQYSSPAKSSEITTKHQKQYAGRLQRKLDNLIDNLPTAIREAIEAPNLPEPKECWIDRRVVTEEQYESYGNFDPELQREWKALSRCADKDWKVSQDRLTTYRTRSRLSKEEVFRMNEVEFGEEHLNFDIEYGTIPYYDHLAAILDLEVELKELKSNSAPDNPQKGA